MSAKLLPWWHAKRWATARVASLGISLYLGMLLGAANSVTLGALPACRSVDTSPAVSPNPPVNQAREPLRGEVELDETWVGGTQAGLRGSRQLKGRKAALVLVAVERRGRATGRVRMEVSADFSAATIREFAARNVVSGSTLYTDGTQELRGIGRGRVPAPPANPAASSSLATGRQVGRPACGPGHRQSSELAHRNAPWSEPRAASGLPRRVCVPPQPAWQTNGCFPDPPGTRCRPRPRHVQADTPRRRSPMTQPVGAS